MTMGKKGSGFNQAEWKEFTKLLRKERIEKGLCEYCGEPRENPKFIRCDKCLAKFRLWRKAHDHKRKQNGICLECKEKTYETSLWCRVHLTIHRKETRRSRGYGAWAPGMGGTRPLDADEPDFELTHGDKEGDIKC
jgi:hypothetical protein